ncbi:MAG TPA: hypothetical protein VKZ79_07655 [Alphaproteobacteria bacterium]|nr:hypothetical protein [Alphaproteobacteria bacterium]
MPDAIPASPGNDQIKSDFLAMRAVAQRGSDDWMRQAALASASPAALNAGQTPAPPQNADFWTKQVHMLAQIGRDYTDTVRERAQELGGDFTRPLDQVPTDLPQGNAPTRGEDPFALAGRAIKTVGDAFGYALSPVEGLGRALLGRPLETATGIPARDTGAFISNLAGMVLGSSEARMAAGIEAPPGMKIPAGLTAEPIGAGEATAAVPEAGAGTGEASTAPAAAAAAKEGVSSGEVQTILGRADVQAAINDSTIDRTHDVPYLAGSSTDGGTTYIDQRLPAMLDIDGKQLDPAIPLNIHEQTEHALMEQGGLSYEDAHRIATAQEKQYVEGQGVDWQKYQDTLQGYIGETEKDAKPGGDTNPPPDLYTKPYPHTEAEFLQRQAQGQNPGDLFPQSEDLRGAPSSAGPRRDFLLLGDPAKDPVEISPEVESQAQDFLAGKSGDNPVKLNFERIATGDDIKAALEQISKSAIPREADSVVSNESTKFVAGQLGLTPEKFLAGYKGGQLDAAETTAMRFMLNDSARQLVDLAAEATDPATATPEAEAKFVRAFAITRGIQQYAENARAQAGRTLQAWSMMAEQRGDYAKAVQSLIENAGGDSDIRTVMRQVAELGDPDKVSQYVAASQRMSSRDLILNGYYNIILSNVPKVLLKKGASDTGMAIWNLATRYAAEKFGSGAVEDGETAAMLDGYVTSMRDAFRLAGKGIATGERQFELGTEPMDALGRGRIDIAAEGAPEALAGQPTRAALDYLKMALPTRWLGAADDFAKYVNYRAELKALALRDGIGQGLEDEALDAHIGQMMATPTRELHEMAKAAALKTTFQEPLTGFAADLAAGADKVNIPIGAPSLGWEGFDIPLGRMVLPFVKIPANIASAAYENSPLAYLFQSNGVKAALAAGGATRDLAIAKMALGSAVTLAASGVAWAGFLTGRGPSDPTLNRAWRAAGNEPYSVKLGDTWYGYNQIDPVGMLLGTIADTGDVLRFARDDQVADQVAASLMFGAGNALISKTYMSGLASFFDAFQQPDKDGSAWLRRFISGATVPAALGAVDRATDDWMRAHYTLLQTIESKLPIVSQQLPPARTLWGDPIPTKDGFLPPFSGTGLARAVSPVPLAPADNAEPIDTWIWNNRDAFPNADQQRLDLYKPGPVQTWEQPGTNRTVSAQVRLQPDQLDRLQSLSGNELKDPHTKMGAKDLLNALVQGNAPAVDQRQWDKASPSVQAMIVLRTVNKFREAAKAQLLTENPILANAVQAQWAARRQALGQGAIRPSSVPSAASAPLASSGRATREPAIGGP